ncbi:formate dehydrogenase [Variovorax sp. J22R133]|uniref:formate dehydrogenase n=1 Tax=Variovorax brevis TaxID=3053503 RepID=UPI00257660CE|nr:formate dehydrogenase [Variovorax sp. J22R133]MDM0111570.1 formate dehydrogenase [Variovorax sp. J22R133]
MPNSQLAGAVAPASRRKFFAGAAAVGAATVAVTVLPGMTEAPADTQAAPALPPAPANGGGYSLSEHVKRYYKSTAA